MTLRGSLLALSALAVLTVGATRAFASDSTGVAVTASATAKRVVGESGSALLVNIGGEVPITADVKGTSNKAVQCSLVDGPSSGSVRSSGVSSCVYTAPLTPGVYRVRVASRENPSAADTVEITVYTVK